MAEFLKRLPGYVMGSKTFRRELLTIGGIGKEMAYRAIEEECPLCAKALTFLEQNPIGSFAVDMVHHQIAKACPKCGVIITLFLQAGAEIDPDDLAAQKIRDDAIEQFIGDTLGNAPELPEKPAENTIKSTFKALKVLLPAGVVDEAGESDLTVGQRAVNWFRASKILDVVAVVAPGPVERVRTLMDQGDEVLNIIHRDDMEGVIMNVGYDVHQRHAAVTAEIEKVSNQKVVDLMDGKVNKERDVLLTTLRKEEVELSKQIANIEKARQINEEEEKKEDSSYEAMDIDANDERAVPGSVVAIFTPDDQVEIVYETKVDLKTQQKYEQQQAEIVLKEATAAREFQLKVAKAEKEHLLSMAKLEAKEIEEAEKLRIAVLRDQLKDLYAKQQEQVVANRERERAAARARELANQAAQAARRDLEEAQRAAVVEAEANAARVAADEVRFQQGRDEYRELARSLGETKRPLDNGALGHGFSFKRPKF